MNLRAYLRMLRKRLVLVLGVLVVFVGAGLVLTILTAKQYEATAQIFVSTQGSTDVADLAQGNTFTQSRVQSYTSVATSPKVSDYVAAAVGGITSKELASETSADAPLNKVLINLHVIDASAARASLLANAVAARFSLVVEDIEQASGNASPVKLSVIQPATTPTSAVTPNVTLNLLLAVIVGLFCGIALAFVRETLDNTIKGPEDLVAQTATAVLGIIPWDKRATDSALAARVDAHGMRAEAFRQLRTNLQFIDVDNPPRVIAVTSALPAEGKTHSALNLAAAVAEAGQRVCLIEADLRKPTVARTLGLASEVGVTSVLIGKSDVEYAIQNAGPNFAVLTSGTVPPNPSELLNSELMRHTIEYIAERVDLVVIDTAPLLPVADGAAICAIADATLLVVRHGKTTREQARRAIDSLSRVGVTPVGSILSMTATRGSSAYSGYYYGDYRPESSRRFAKQNGTDDKVPDATYEHQAVPDLSS